MDTMNFEEMRNQFAILKEQLDKQEIVNDRLLRETMMIRNKDISSTKRMGFICLVACLLLMPLNLITHSWSTLFSIVTVLLLLISAVATYYIHKPVDSLNFMKDDFSTVARVMARFKKQYNQWTWCFSTILIIPWIVWACYDFAWKGVPEGTNHWKMLIPLIIAAVVGGIIGYLYYCKAVNAAQDIIDQIEKE